MRGGRSSFINAEGTTSGWNPANAIVRMVEHDGASFAQRQSGAPDRNRRDVVSGQGSAGNVIAALCSFFIPGLGQLIQGRLMMAVFQFVLAGALWFVMLGWAVHLWSVLDAAMWKAKV